MNLLVVAAQSLEHLTSVRKVMGSIFSLSHIRDMLFITSFLISSPSLKFTIFLLFTTYRAIQHC